MKILKVILALNVTLMFAGPVHAEIFSIKFLGGAANDPVTNSAGAVATTAWNNLTNGFNGTIIADNTATAALAITGNGGGWKSGIAGDGGNASLLDGYLDSGNGFSCIVTISNLVGEAYDVYLYTVGDSSKPGNGGDWQPNYALNGTICYTSIQGPPPGANTYAGALVQSGVAPTNTNIIPTPILPYGNYIKISNVVPTNKVLVIKGEADNQSWRSPLNGVQLVRKVGNNFGSKFLGDTSDKVTGIAGVVPTPNWNNLTNKYSGTVSVDNNTTATVTITGNGGGWHSPITAGDGLDRSLLRGYLDSGAGFSNVVTLSGLTGASYTMYLYIQGDAKLPADGNAWQPNYSINGTKYFTSCMDPATYAGAFVPGGIAPTNTNVFPSPLAYGNYITVFGVAPVGGTITVIAEADLITWRTPLNGIEFVKETGPIVSSVSVSPGTNVYAGTAVTLTANVVGTGPVYQWRSDDGIGGSLNLISGASGSNYIVNTGSLIPGPYRYDVVVTNISGGVTSSVVALNVSPASAPFVTKDTTVTPTNRLAVGQPVTFSATFDGTQPITYQWQVNKGTGYTNISGATSTSLGFSSLTFGHAGNYRLVASNSVSLNASSPTALTILDPALVPELFAVKFLGSTKSDTVIKTAGVVPTAVWNNLTNGFNGSIRANNSATANLALSGSAGEWNSNIQGDGGNNSLMHGFLDAGQGNKGIVTITGLPGAAYDLYLYTLSDGPKPGNGGDWQPNYNVNGRTYYTSVQGGTSFSNTFVQGGISFTNSGGASGFPTPVLPYGNYIKVKATPTNGTIVVTAEQDNQSWRSPLNGIELVRIVALNITTTVGATTVTWPTNDTGYTLQSRATASSGTWAPVTPSPTIVGANYQVTLPETNSTRYFRLQYP